jgi:hypothetical protein
MTQTPPAKPAPPQPTAPRVLSPEAQRALAEAAERRRQAEATAHERTKEIGGQKGPDPVRYGDWEKAGIVSDF